jgi:hypothetical protein
MKQCPADPETNHANMVFIVAGSGVESLGKRLSSTMGMIGFFSGGGDLWSESLE